MFVAGVASVECFDRLSNRHAVVAAIGGIAAAAPGVVAQARHGFLGVAGIGGEAALVVGDGVVHGLSVVGCGKDSRFFIIGRQNLFTALYRNVIFSNW